MIVASISSGIISIGLILLLWKHPKFKTLRNRPIQNKDLIIVLFLDVVTVILASLLMIKYVVNEEFNERAIVAGIMVLVYLWFQKVRLYFKHRKIVREGYSNDPDFTIEYLIFYFIVPMSYLFMTPVLVHLMNKW